MRTFAEKPKATQQANSPKRTVPVRSHLGHNHEVNSILHLQRTLGNQTVQRLLQSDAEKRNTVLTDLASSRFRHDFNRIPIHPLAVGAIQTKLSINTPGDEYEHEADRVADQVMRMPEQKLQRTCACGGGCPVCQKEQTGQERARLQTKRLQSAGAGRTEAPPEIREVLAAPGQPLNSATREFMELRIGHDFSRVQIHADKQAAASAEAINARAYTVGHNIVFGHGEYNPSALSSRRLLAHELTHVVQQEGGLSTVQRTPREDPCTYAGGAVKDREVHLNLGLNAVRVYTRGSGHTQFNNLINGPAARDLARANDWCHMYSVKGHQRRSSLGLINFVNYCRNFGFHSNFWHKDGSISRIPSTVSHGCARLHDSDERSTATGDSNRFYELVQDNDCVRLYSQSFWRDPTFRRCPSDGENCRP